MFFSVIVLRNAQINVRSSTVFNINGGLSLIFLYYAFADILILELTWSERCLLA